MANNTSISNLSEVEEVNAGDFFIIDTPNGTQKIDFGNVLIPLDNATFNTTISAHATDITTNRTEIQTLTAALYDGGDTTLAVGSLSTQSLTAGAFNLTGDSLALSDSNATLPATTCTSLSSPSVSAVNAAKAWVNFDGTSSGGTKTINNSFNVSSVTDIAAGSFVVTFTVPMSNDNYAFSGGTSNENTGGNRGTNGLHTLNMSASGVHVFTAYGATHDSDGAAHDNAITAVIVHGN